MSKKPTVLMILDGYGLNETANGNAVAGAKTPVIKWKYRRKICRKLSAMRRQMWL